jgi:hypothetical protein
MFANMKIGVRLAIGFAAVLALLLAVAAIGLHPHRGAEHRGRRPGERQVPQDRAGQ